MCFSHSLDSCGYRGDLQWLQSYPRCFFLGLQEDDGILADTRTFGILIDGSVKKGDLDTADFWLQRAELAGRFDPTV